jgi:hypothetical protein
MKVIFLDIDGCLNSEKSLKRRTKLYVQKLLPMNEIDYPSQPHVAHLNKILEYTNARIVVSSTWRLLHPIYDSAVDIIKDTRSNSLETIFRLQGILGRIHDVTPNIKFGGHRGLDIQSWLYDNEVDRYVILDDVDEFLEEQQPHFVQTTFKDGLTEELANRAIKILNS